MEFFSLPVASLPTVRLKAHTPAKLYFKLQKSPQVAFPPIESVFSPLAD
jgi:hypothetical protein